MPPKPTGTVSVVALADGTRAFRLRFRVGDARQLQVLHGRPNCLCGCGGGWDERAARRELGNVLARVRAGVWTPPRPQSRPEPAERVGMPTFHQYAFAWLEAKVHGVLGENPIDANTEADYRWRLTRHLLPFFAEYRLDAIYREPCAAFKAHKLTEAAELRAALAADADLRDRRGRRLRSGSAGSSPRPAGRPPRSSRRAGFRRCRRPRRTRCGAPTSRSRCSPTASTSSGP